MIYWIVFVKGEEQGRKIYREQSVVHVNNHYAKWVENTKDGKCVTVTIPLHNIVEIREVVE